ncbi:hypothetical protein HAX54_023516, partial [Datura stramonium]|nr:hypothetical protein [Datura stramonium]
IDMLFRGGRKTHPSSPNNDATEGWRMRGEGGVVVTRFLVLGGILKVCVTVWLDGRNERMGNVWVLVFGFAGWEKRGREEEDGRSVTVVVFGRYLWKENGEAFAADLGKGGGRKEGDKG